MKGNKHYTPRLIGSFLLSCIIGWGLNILVSLVLVSTLVLVPMLLECHKGYGHHTLSWVAVYCGERL